MVVYKNDYSVLDSSHRHHHHLPLKAMACLRTAKMSIWGSVLQKGCWDSLFPFYTFLLISLFSQLCGRSGPSMEGPIIWKAAMACLSWIYYCWFQGNGGPTWTSRNSRKWEGRGGGFWTTECVFPMGVLAALYCHCFYRGKWCSGQCSLFPTGEPRLDRKWRRSVIGGQSFVSAHLIISAVFILKCPINTNQITVNSK